MATATTTTDPVEHEAETINPEDQPPQLSVIAVHNHHIVQGANLTPVREDGSRLLTLFCGPNTVEVVCHEELCGFLKASFNGEHDPVEVIEAGDDARS